MIKNLLKRHSLYFLESDAELLQKLEGYCNRKGNYKINRGIIELLEFALKCNELGYQLIDNKLIRIEELS
jgi:hypothetical protein